MESPQYDDLLMGRSCGTLDYTPKKLKIPLEILFKCCTHSHGILPTEFLPLAATRPSIVAPVGVETYSGVSEKVIIRIMIGFGEKKIRSSGRSPAGDSRVP
jgi:hypothetical protein